jgi:hypothetical protein
MMTLIQKQSPRSLRQSRARCSRDRELLGFVGRHGVVSIEHVMTALGVRRASAYRRVAACIQRGLLERLYLLRDEPSLICATRAGLRYAGLGLPVPVVSPGAVDHWLRCASTAQLLVEEFGSERVITERELAMHERIEGRPIASAKLGELPSGAPRLHRPDLVVLPPATSAFQAPEDWIIRSPIAVEVELTPKAPRRLEQIVRAWRRAGWVEEVRYYCAPGSTTRAVQRAVDKTRAEGRVQILEALPR